MELGTWGGGGLRWEALGLCYSHDGQGLSWGGREAAGGGKPAAWRGFTLPHPQEMAGSGEGPNSWASPALSDNRALLPTSLCWKESPCSPLALAPKGESHGPGGTCSRTHPASSHPIPSCCEPRARPVLNRSRPFAKYPVRDKNRL